MEYVAAIFGMRRGGRSVIAGANGGQVWTI